MLLGTDSSMSSGLQTSLRQTDTVSHSVGRARLRTGADETLVVMVPDLFDGDPVPLNRPDAFDSQAWRNGGYHPKGTAHLPANVDPIVDTCLAEMRTKYGCKVCSSCTVHTDREDHSNLIISYTYRASARWATASAANM